MTSQIILVRDGIKEALLKSGNVARWCAARVYHFQAPAGTPLDCVEYKLTAGADDNTSPREGSNTTWEVYGVSTSEDHAMAICEAIEYTMVNAGLIIPGWDCFSVTARDWLIRKVWIEGQEYWMVGKFYDVSIVKRS